MTREVAGVLYQTYHDILGTLVGTINNPDKWVLRGRPDPDDS